VPKSLVIRFIIALFASFFPIMALASSSGRMETGRVDGHYEFLLG